LILFLSLFVKIIKTSVFQSGCKIQINADQALPEPVLIDFVSEDDWHAFSVSRCWLAEIYQHDFFDTGR